MAITRGGSLNHLADPQRPAGGEGSGEDDGADNSTWSQH